MLIATAQYCSLDLVFDPAYRTDDGQPWVLPVVRTIEAQMSADLTLNHEYLPLSGLTAFCDASTKLLLGESSPAITQNRVRDSNIVAPSYFSATWLFSREGFTGSKHFVVGKLYFLPIQVYIFSHNSTGVCVP